MSDSHFAFPGLRFVTRTLIVGLFTAALGIGCWAPAHAEQHKPRLSKDLQARLDAGSTDPVSIIVEGNAETVARRHGVEIKKQLRTGAVLQVTGEQLAAMSADPEISHLSGDARVQRMMSVAATATGADQVWGGIAGLPGFTGAGIGVAIIDSGVEQHHKSLKGRVVASFDFIGGKGNDAYGHGTHVAGILAGEVTGSYPGMAPGAHIVSLRVLDAQGAGDTSDVIAAIDFAVENRARYNLRIINLSLGHPVFESYRDDPLCQAVERAVQAGMVVVAAAGNFGKTADGRPVIGGIVSPGNSPSAITVGALNTKSTPFPSDDVMATYSSRGLTAIDGLLKPELVAPGNRIVSAAAHNSTLAAAYPERIVGGTGSNSYMEMSGTSMATPMVAGAAALLLEAEPTLSPAEVKLALQLSSRGVAGSGLIESGAGALNVGAAIQLLERSPAPNTTIGGELVDRAGLYFFGCRIFLR